MNLLNPRRPGAALVKRFPFSVFIVMVFLAGVAFGQSPNASISGLVLDPAGRAIVGAELLIVDDSTGLQSFVEIDDRQNKIKPGNWQNEFERPIYFVELRDGYVCSWCELNGSQLILIPSPQSRTQVRQVRYPADAGIVGRVTTVTMTLVDPK